MSSSTANPSRAATMVAPAVAALCGDDPAVRGETFQGHWEQLRDIATTLAVPTVDDLVAVVNLLDQMTSLLQLELDAAEDETDQVNGILDRSEPENPLDSLRESHLPCLDLLLTENILSHVLATSRMPVDPVRSDQLRLQQLLIYETLLGSGQFSVLMTHQPFQKPLLELISEFVRLSKDDSACTCEETELHFVLVLEQLCKRIRDDKGLIDVFFVESGDFAIFSLLVSFMHRDGRLGQSAKDALLICVALSREDPRVGEFIANHSDFCPVLATGLSGLYSVLPRRLPARLTDDPTWHELSDYDVRQMHELTAFLTSLKFCDAVIRTGHPKVKQHLLGLIYMGFLVPVLGPALTQDFHLHYDFSDLGARSVESELICATSYLSLFLRYISEPELVAVFLRFIFVDPCDDGKVVADVLTFRIGSQTQLCQVTMSLFNVLLDLNCEDVIFWLVFRHLISLRHLLPSQRDAIRRPDLHGRAADRILALSPICCQEANSAKANITHSTSMSFSQLFVGRRPQQLPQSTDSSEHFHLYLRDARAAVRMRNEATRCWLYEYDGLDPPPPIGLDGEHNNSSSNNNSTEEEGIERAVDALNLNAAIDASVESSGYTSLAHLSSSPSVSGPVSMTNEEEREFWSLMKEPLAGEARLHKVIVRMQQHDELSTSSGGGLSLTGSDAGDQETSPRGRKAQDDIDLNVKSLGCFLDLLLEKVELMPSSNLCTNLLATKLLTQLATFPHPLLRSVLIQPDIVCQPSIRTLPSALEALRTKLDNVMPTLSGAEEAISLARRFLQERIDPNIPRIREQQPQSTVASTFSQLGQEASRHRSSFTAAFTSIFRRRSAVAPATAPTAADAHSAPASLTGENGGGPGGSSSSGGGGGGSFGRGGVSNLCPEVRAHALAAVLLEEFLLELAAVAQEQSVLQKERAFEIGMGIIDKKDIITTIA